MTAGTTFRRVKRHMAVSLLTLTFSLLSKWMDAKKDRSRASPPMRSDEGLKIPSQTSYNHFSVPLHPPCMADKVAFLSSLFYFIESSPSLLSGAVEIMTDAFAQHGAGHRETQRFLGCPSYCQASIFRFVRLDVIIKAIINHHARGNSSLMQQLFPP